MKNVLLISHGKLAEGMLDTLSLFYGDLEDIDCLCLKPDQNPDDFRQQIEEKLKAFENEETIIVGDILGGTPLNQSAYFANDKVTVLSGMNLGMLLDLISKRDLDTMNYDESLESGKCSIVNLNKMMGA